MTDYKISEENAEKQLDDFNEWYDLDPEDFEEMAKDNKEAQSAYNVVRRKLIRAIRRGYLEIREETDKKGAPTLIVEQRLKNPIGDVTKVTYKEVTGLARAAVQVGEKDNNTLRTYKFLGILCGEGKEIFENMRGSDLGVVDCLGFLLMQV